MSLERVIFNLVLSVISYAIEQSDIFVYHNVNLSILDLELGIAILLTEILVCGISSKSCPSYVTYISSTRQTWYLAMKCTISQVT